MQVDEWSKSAGSPAPANEASSSSTADHHKHEKHKKKKKEKVGLLNNTVLYLTDLLPHCSLEGRGNMCEHSCFPVQCYGDSVFSFPSSV